MKEKIVKINGTKIWFFEKINKIFLNNQHVTEEIKREIKKILETNDNENTTQNILLNLHVCFFFYSLFPCN